MRLLIATAATLALLLMGPGAALALDSCPGKRPSQRVIATGQGQLESAVVDDRGRLLFTSVFKSALMRIERPGTTPRLVADGIPIPGGLALDPRGRIYVGSGNSIANGLLAPAQGLAQLYRVDPRTGAKRVFATGLSMANGLVRRSDGTFFASDDFAPSVDRISPRGKVKRAWSTAPSTNGLALDPSERFLYANRSFGPTTQVLRIDVRRPERVIEWATPPAAEASSVLDGMAIDSRGRLLLAAFGPGELWRSDGRGKLCALARGLGSSLSAVAVGRGRRGFRAGRNYTVAFNGTITEVKLR